MRLQVAAYAASRLPCTYAALHRVFSEVRACSLNLRVDVALTPARQLSARVPSFRPQTLLDFGSGPGTASLAVASMWPASLRESVAVEISRDMLELADMLRDSMNAAAGGAEGPHEAAPAAAPRAADAVPPSRVVPHLSRLNGRQQRRRYDIVVAAFSLGELPNEVRACQLSLPYYRCMTRMPASLGGAPADGAAAVVSRLRRARHRGARHAPRLCRGPRGA